MPFRVSGKNIDIGEALRARINQRVAEATAKYFDGGFSGHVTVGKEGFGFRTECAIHLDSGITLEAQALAADAYASADQAAMRIEKRLRRYKRRLKDHQVARAALASEASGQRGNSLEVRAPRADGQALEEHARDRPTIEAPSYVIAAPEHDADEEASEWNPVIIAESTTALKRLSVSEAVMELDMIGAAVVVFRHAGHGRINLVYRRADGHIGWIDPPTIDQDAH
jgi:ribosomal subunit interface protein